MSDIHAEPVHTAVQPEPEHAAELLPHLRVLPVQIRLGRVEEVQVPLAVCNARPRGTAEKRLPVVRGQFAVHTLTFAEHVAGTLCGTSRRRESGSEPFVILGGVVGHEIHNEFQAQIMGFIAHPIEVVKSAEPRVNGAVIGHVVPGVMLRRQVEGGQPHRIHAQLLEVGQFFGHTAQVAHPVSVGVLEGARIHLVDHGVPPPLGTGLLTWGH